MGCRSWKRRESGRVLDRDVSLGAACFRFAGGNGRTGAATQQPPETALPGRPPGKTGEIFAVLHSCFHHNPLYHKICQPGTSFSVSRGPSEIGHTVGRENESSFDKSRPSAFLPANPPTNPTSDAQKRRSRPRTILWSCRAFEGLGALRTGTFRGIWRISRLRVRAD